MGRYTTATSQVDTKGDMANQVNYMLFPSPK